MNKGTDPLDEGIRALFPDPEETFLSRLEAQLVQQTTARNRKGEPKGWFPGWGELLRRQPVPLALVVLMLALVAAVIVGPSRVLAQIRSLLTFVPGIGFSQTAEAYLLPEPVVEHRNGVTLHIEQVLAQTDRTAVVLYVEGMDLEEQNLFVSNSFLRLPEGKALSQQGYEIGWQSTTLIFGTLPAGISKIELVWSENFVRDWYQEPEGAWAIPLVLEPAGDLDSLKMAASYTLEDIHLTLEDRIIRLAGVSQGPDQTAIQLELLWPAEYGQTPFYIGQAKLEDDLGTNYEQLNELLWDEQGQPIETKILGTPAPLRYHSIHQTLVFRPGVPDAGQFQLTLGRITLREQLETSFTLELGSPPAVGDFLPLDVWFEVAQVPLHLNGAQVVEAETHHRSETVANGVALEFTLDALPEGGEELLNWISFRSPQVPQFLFAGYSQDPATRIYISRLPLGGGNETILSGKIRVVGDWSEVVLPGTWPVTWDVPES